MVWVALALLLLRAVPCAALFDAPVPEVDGASLAADDQCQEESCALNALQVRINTMEGVDVEEEAITDEQGGWSLFGTTEQCCKCKSGVVGWSQSGECSFCKGKVVKKKSVSRECQTKSKTFEGNKVCANSCKKVFGALLQVGDAVAEGTDAESEVIAHEEEDWSIFGTTEKCCKCKNGDVGYSQSGRCSFCEGKVAKKRDTEKYCQEESFAFKGSQFCDDRCQKVFDALLQVGDTIAESTDAESEVTAHEEEDWSILGTTEQCCKCKSGTAGWSSSGKCSFCKGNVAKKKSVSKECQKKSKTFSGNKVCANTCSKMLGGSSSPRRRSWR